MYFNREWNKLQLLAFPLSLCRFISLYKGPCHTHKVQRLNESTSYSFRIQAFNEAGEGPFSSVYTFTTPRSPPAPLKGKVFGSLAFHLGLRALSRVFSSFFVCMYISLYSLCVCLYLAPRVERLDETCEISWETLPPMKGDPIIYCLQCMQGNSDFKQVQLLLLVILFDSSF